ncbi:pyridoxal-phosphate dependent enzyme [Kibdelosporangium philippinense]|uniref:Pyridoxal-phosphate dependent enzyme n=1 Tax=Kibdelosporangium philippinense TaxID=211113 RepID=A0ABS8Z2R1_9PSEU|nr:pyridoxal-phosphate dependent enzyme [Kibdelosporangium philippinense]MCE7002219.1 pyridoxal-phosphate dependent enzyme [Kibdelosporangium philippinense]
MGSVTGSVDLAGCEWLRYDYGPARMARDRPDLFTMWRYRELLPIPDGPMRYPVPIGGTPLLHAPALRQTLGTPYLWIKDETRNPSASNKDRATALVIEDGLRRGVGTITTASTGNAAVATAFGAAAAGMRAVIFVSTDCLPEKLALMTQAGAWVFQVREGYAAAVDLSRTAARTFGWLDRNTGANPFTIEAKKTVAFEVWEQLDRRLPDVVIVPVGDGPTLVALEKGFTELISCGLATRRPRLIGVQAERCQPLVRAWHGEPARPTELDPRATVADGIAVIRPAIGDAVLEVVRRSGGAMVSVTDDALLSAVATLAGRAGVGAEPAGAAALAGLESAVDRGLASRLETVVLLITGREVKAGEATYAPDRVSVVESLDEVERELAE